MNAVTVQNNPEIDALKFVLQALIKTMPPNPAFEPYLARTLEMLEEGAKAAANFMGKEDPDLATAWAHYHQQLRMHVHNLLEKPMPQRN